MKWTEVEVMQAIADAGISVSAFDGTVECFDVQLFDLVQNVVSTKNNNLLSTMIGMCNYIDKLGGDSKAYRQQIHFMKGEQ